MRVLTFSRSYPAKHPKSGQPTHFVEQIWKSFYKDGVCPDEVSGWINAYMKVMDVASFNAVGKKHHTIRAGNRWKPGDKFSARVWSGLPYRSKQVEFAQIEVKEVHSFRIDYAGYWLNDQYVKYEQLCTIARNDGLEPIDFIDWFEIHPKKVTEFRGQIISWSDNLNY